MIDVRLIKSSDDDEFEILINACLELEYEIKYMDFKLSANGVGYLWVALLSKSLD